MTIEHIPAIILAGGRGTRISEYSDSIPKPLVPIGGRPILAHIINIYAAQGVNKFFIAGGYKIDELIPFIKDELYKLNIVKGEHPIIPYASSEGRKMLINTVKMLNHKWIIADFSDGEFWGEVFLTYEVTEDKQLKFKLVEHFLYQFEYIDLKQLDL